MTLSCEPWHDACGKGTGVEQMVGCGGEGGAAGGLAAANPGTSSGASEEEKFGCNQSRKKKSQPAQMCYFCQFCVLGYKRTSHLLSLLNVRLVIKGELLGRCREVRLEVFAEVGTEDVAVQLRVPTLGVGTMSSPRLVGSLSSE